SLFVGPVGVLAAAAAVGEPRRRALVGLLLVIALAGALVAMSGWPGTWIRAIPPLDRLRYPAKALLFPHFALSVLAGLGLDRLRFAPGDRLRRLALSVAAVGALVLVWFCERIPAVRWAGVVAAICVFALTCGVFRRSGVTGALAMTCAASV